MSKKRLERCARSLFRGIKRASGGRIALWRALILRVWQRVQIVPKTACYVYILAAVRIDTHPNGRIVVGMKRGGAAPPTTPLIACRAMHGKGDDNVDVDRITPQRTRISWNLYKQKHETPFFHCFHLTTLVEFCNKFYNGSHTNRQLSNHKINLLQARWYAMTTQAV